MPVTVSPSTTTPTTSTPGTTGSKPTLPGKLAVDDSESGTTIAFPDVCKTPAPPAPFVATPYPNLQYQENLRKANKADADAQAGNKKAQTEVSLAIKGAVIACRGSESGSMHVSSATQAVMIGRTLHYKYVEDWRWRRK